MRDRSARRREGCPPSRECVSGSASSATICGTVPGNRSGASRGRSLNAARWRSGRSERATNGGAGREAGRLDRNRGAASHGIDEGLGARVPARQHDQLRRHRLAQRRRPGGHARAAAMPRPAADVDADDRTPRSRRSCAPHDEHDVRRVGVDFGRRRLVTPSASTIAFLTTPRSWSGDASKSERGTNFDREAQAVRRQGACRPTRARAGGRRRAARGAPQCSSTDPRRFATTCGDGTRRPMRRARRRDRAASLPPPASVSRRARRTASASRAA